MLLSASDCLLYVSFSREIYMWGCILKMIEYTENKFSFKYKSSNYVDFMFNRKVIKT